MLEVPIGVPFSPSLLADGNVVQQEYWAGDFLTKYYHWGPQIQSISSVLAQLTFMNA